MTTNSTRDGFDSPFEFTVTGGCPTIIGTNTEYASCQACGLSYHKSVEHSCFGEMLRWHSPGPWNAIPREPVEPHGDGGVRFDKALMEVGRPYPFQVDGKWAIAVLRADGSVDIGHMQDGLLE